MQLLEKAYSRQKKWKCKGPVVEAGVTCPRSSDEACGRDGVSPGRITSELREVVRSQVLRSLVALLEISGLHSE